jgi:PAS domain S-box-containing protein
MVVQPEVPNVVPGPDREEISRLRRSDRVYEMLFERAPSGIALVAVDGRFIRVNPAFCTLVGRTEQELLEKGFSEITHPDDLAVDQSLAADVLAGRIDRYDIDKRYVRPDGSIVWVHLTVAVIRTDDGTAEHFVSMVEDITERHHAAEQLRIALDVLRTTFEYSPVAMAELELDGTVVRANAAVGALIDVQPSELIGTKTVEILSPAEREDGLRNLARLVAGEVPAIHRERRIRDRTGRDRWVSVHTAAVFGPSGTAERLIMQAIDVTEASELREQLEQSVEALSQAFREKVGLMSALSHDLRAPLAAIRILAQMLDERPQGEEQRDLTRRLLAEAERTEAVLGDLVSSERAAAGLVVPRRSPVDLGRLVDRVVRGYTDSARRFVVGDAPADSVVYGDPALLERMVDNLVANAVRHTSPPATVWVGLAESSATVDAIELSVEDDGDGVPDESKAAIFEPYVRGHRTDRPGSGIGLFLVREFAEHHGGTAECVDRPGGGVRFVVTLPRSGRPAGSPAP